MTLLSCKHLTTGVNGRQLLSRLDLSVESGSCWGILGPNGSGKSNLLKTIVGLLPAVDGEILIKGKEQLRHTPRELARILGILHQETSFHFPLTVEDYVLAGRYPYHTWLSRESNEDRQIASDAMKSIGIDDLSNRHCHTLSGGEARKASMAMLVCQSPDLALLDEPENHLDPGVRYQLVRKLKEMFTANGKALIMVLHDPSIALRLCSHLLLIGRDGSTITGEVDEIGDEAHLSRIYGHRMRLLESGDQRLVYPE